MENGTHTWASFSWAPVSLTYSFSGPTVSSTVASGTSVNVLTGCTYPNGTGYSFSYGAWGIVNEIDYLSAQDNQQVRHKRSYESYNFPDASQALSDAPRYTTMTASPDGSSTSVWNYSENQSGPGQVNGETVTDPLGNITSISLNADGTLNSLQITDNLNHLFQRKDVTWTTAGASSVIGSVKTTDDGGNAATVSYGYDSLGNVNDLKEFDFGGQLLRETVTSYKGAPYSGPSGSHILNLPQSIQIKDGSGVVQAQTDFAYDEGTRVALSPFPVQNDGNTTAPRGNRTSLIRYPNMSHLTQKIVRAFTYTPQAIFVTAQVDCCNQNKFNFDAATQYAYLSSSVRGPDSGQQFTTTFTFNKDNGVLVNSSDENSQQTSFQYDTMYRVTKVIPPLSNGAAPLAQLLTWTTLPHLRSAQPPMQIS